MSRRAWFAALVFSVSAATAVPAAEPRIGRLVAYELADYTIYTTRSSSQARRFATELGKFQLTLEKLLGKRAAKNHIPTHLVILSRSEWEKYLQPRKHVAGWFQPGMFSNVIVMNGDAEGTEVTHLVFHEYTHYYLSSQFAGEYPPWFNEGLAEVMGYARFDNNGVVLLIPEYRVREARDGDWIPFERLIRVDRGSPEYQSHKLADSFYAQAWLTVHYGLLENRDFGRQVFQYLTKLNTLVPHEQAAKAAFGDLAAVDAQLRAYSRNNKMHSGGMALGELPEVTLPAEKPVAPIDALALIADLMLDTRQAPERTRPLIESLARREPGSARPAILAARQAYLDGDNAAFDAATTKAESLLSENDWQGRRELASVLLQNAQDYRSTNKRTTEESEQDLKRAMRWFGEAIKHNAEDVEALWGFGTAAAQLETNLDLAEAALVAAYRRAPSSAYIAVSLANLKGRQDKPEEMIPYLKDTIRYATDLGMRQWASNTLLQMQDYIAERDRIDAENRKQREAYEKQLADYEKKYGKPRTKKK
jgi:tetratricopeptide (TPR) repeat protein